MKIDIEINDDVCQIILNKFDYVTEKVTLYYDRLSNFRGMEDAPVNELTGMDCIVAYPAGRKPETLNEEYPLVENCEEIMYDKVVKDLFNSWLLKTMFQHKPY